MNLLRQYEENPFTPHAKDVDAACPHHLLISNNDHDDEEIEIDLAKTLDKQFRQFKS